MASSIRWVLLENYDVVGAWRDRDLDAGVAIDSAGRLSSGIEVSGPSQLREALLRRPNQFVQTLTEKLMTFALGRAVTYQDMPTIRAIVRDSADKGYRFASIVQGIVASPAFKMSEVAPNSPQTPQRKQATLGTPKEASLDAPKDSRS